MTETSLNAAEHSREYWRIEKARQAAELFKGLPGDIPEFPKPLKPKKRYYIPILGNGSNSGKLTWARSMFFGFPDIHANVALHGDSHADRAMNRIANEFLRTDCDEMLVIDCDIEFTPDHVRFLLEHDVPLVYGVYPKKEEFMDGSIPACLAPFPDGLRQSAASSHLKEVRRVGRGFMRVARAVLEAMKEDNGGPALRYHNHGQTEWHFFASGALEDPAHPGELDKDGYLVREWKSEDWEFCDRAWKLGFPVVFDERIGLGHDGTRMFRFQSHDWREIPGWFSDADAGCYREIIKAIPSDGTFVEVGSFLGRSMGCFTCLCRELNKNPLAISVDTFKGTPGEDLGGLIASGINLENAFLSNLIRTNTKPDKLRIMKMESGEAATQLALMSADAVFIDADHSFEAVLNDISLWWPVVKQGGILAGHDWSRQSVKEAVLETFLSEQVEVIGDCWLIRKIFHHV